MSTTTVTSDNLQSTVGDNDIVILDFWADWCGPCRNFAPVYEAASAKHEDIVFGKVDTEAEQQLAGAFGITFIPTLMVFRQGVGVFSQAGGTRPPQLEELIDGVRNLDMEDVHKQVEEQKAKMAEQEAAGRHPGGQDPSSQDSGNQAQDQHRSAGAPRDLAHGLLRSQTYLRTTTSDASTG